MRQPASRRLEALLAVAVLVLALGYLLPYAFRGWIPHDEGMLGQLGQRTLAGELPHRDFDDPYTGGLSFLYAAAFALLGDRLASIRWVLLLAVACSVPFLWALARRLAPPWLAALTVFVALAWTVPNYFAGLPSWYNLFAALIALELLLRAGDGDARRGSPWRWLALAGVVAGASCTVKVTGLYLLAAAILILVEREQRDARVGPPIADAARPGGAPGRGFLHLTAAGGIAFVAALTLLVAEGLRSGRSGPPASVLGHFVLPGALLAGYLVWREATLAPSPFGTAARLRRLAAALLPFAAGWLLPIAGLLAVYAAQGAVDDLGRGVFVLPRLRFRFATFPLPPAWSLLAAAPVGLLLAWPWRGERRGRAIRAGLAVAVALALGAVAVTGGRLDVYRAVWLPLRALLPVAVAAGVIVLARRRSGGAPAALDAGTVFAFLATAAMTGLIQYPDAYGIYFFYAAPPLILALLAVAGGNPRAPRAALLALLVFAGVFAGRWLHGADPLTFGLQWRPARWDFALDLPRGGLVVDRRRGAEATAVVLEALAHAEPGDALLAAPDCPEIAFLAGLRNPTRSFFEFFDPAASEPAALAALLDRHDVRVVVVNLRPSFSPPFPEPVARMLRQRYAGRKQIGDYIVLWR